MLIGALITFFFGTTDLESWAIQSSKTEKESSNINNKNYMSLNNE